MPALDTEWLVSFAKQLNRVSLLTFLVPAIIGIRRWPVLERPYRALVGFVLVPGCLLGTLAEVGRLVWHNNVIINYLITWTETFFLTWAFYTSLHAVRAHTLLKAGCVLFVLVAVVERVYFSSSFGAQAYTRIMQSILLIGAALLYFEQTLQELRNIRLERDPMFLVSVGVTLYYAGALMVFVLEDSMQQQHQWNQIWTMYIIQFALLIVLNVLFGMALWYASRPRPQPGIPPSY